MGDSIPKKSPSCEYSYEPCISKIHLQNCIQLIEVVWSESEGLTATCGKKWVDMSLKFQHLKTPKNFTGFCRPITEARVMDINDEKFRYRLIEYLRRHEGVKPVFVDALIKMPLDNGEGSGSFPSLAKLIRNRGFGADGGDDCGHVVAQCLGGKMVDFNLFPQNKDINQGLKGKYYIWKGLEIAMRDFVRFAPPIINPRVRLQIELVYEQGQKETRPSGFKSQINFLWDERKEGNDDHENDDHKNMTTLKVLVETTVAFFAEGQRAYALLKEKVEAIRKTVAGWNEELAEEFLKNLESILPPPIPEKRPDPIPEKTPDPILERPQPEPSRSPRPSIHMPQLIRTRRTSVYDFLPVVGACRALGAGYEDFRDGYPISGAINMTVGAVSGTLDVFTLGAASTALNGFTRVAMGQVAKKGAEKIALKMAEKAAEKAATTAGISMWGIIIRRIFTLDP